MQDAAWESIEGIVVAAAPGTCMGQRMLVRAEEINSTSSRRWIHFALASGIAPKGRSQLLLLAEESLRSFLLLAAVPTCLILASSEL
jgi:hypothetical protein